MSHRLAYLGNTRHSFFPFKSSSVLYSRQTVLDVSVMVFLIILCLNFWGGLSNISGEVHLVLSLLPRNKNACLQGELVNVHENICQCQRIVWKICQYAEVQGKLFSRPGLY